LDCWVGDLSFGAFFASVVEVMKVGSDGPSLEGDCGFSLPDRGDFSVTGERLFFSGGGEKDLSSGIPCLTTGEGERWRFLLVPEVIVVEGVREFSAE
jgi:hypothetical protein